MPGEYEKHWFKYIRTSQPMLFGPETRVFCTIAHQKRSGYVFIFPLFRIKKKDSQCMIPVGVMVIATAIFIPVRRMMLLKDQKNFTTVTKI